MKLRNKKTGEIGELNYYDGSIQVVDIDSPLCGNSVKGDYNSLAELNEEWEDYEDEHLYVISAETHVGYECVLKDEHTASCGTAVKLGIGFETEKEAQRAVKKLKAWTRLKDKGFKFVGWGCGNQTLYAKIQLNEKVWTTGTEPDLDLLFGGDK